MDWLLPIYEGYLQREHDRRQDSGQGLALQEFFMQTLAESTATLFVMEPLGDTIRFRGLGRWDLPRVPNLLTDPNAFIAERFGGGKYKINFHHQSSFVGTHNFRTWGDEKWREMEELDLG